MNEHTPTPPTSPAASPSAEPIPTAPSVAPSPRSSSAAQFLARLSIGQMTLALVLAVFLWQWLDAHRQIDSMQQELAKRLTEMDGNNKASQMLVQQSQETTRELGAKVSLLETRYAESQSQRAALEALYQDLSSSRDETALAEVEQMLLIAGQQLQLSANIKAALIAMQQADSRLQRLNRPALNGLRKNINADIDKLRVLPAVDIPGLNLRLDNLISSVDNLPLVYDIRPAAVSGKPKLAPVQDENAVQKLLREIWQEAKHLVRIEDTRKRELPLLSPTETFFLRENLKLRLLSARLALLSRDEASFRHDLQTAQEWVKVYFNADSVEGKQALSALQKLAVSSINIELPDISGSIEAVRGYRLSHEKAAK
ncbi:MAG: uroporphyrinogen-III C-methyltransferase [Nitrosomonadales bacterium]|nr:uroporphyrinogen-III C-methyltransferase [Nitrosomonadales bacterium]